MVFRVLTRKGICRVCKRDIPAKKEWVFRFHGLNEYVNICTECVDNMYKTIHGESGLLIKGIMDVI